MAERTRGMGRGLAAILSTAPADAEAELRELPVDLIVPNPQQPRRRFDEEPLVALADSLKDRGVLQPVLVRPVTGGTYELIAGERRWRAARRAGLPSIPGIVRTADDTSSLEQALVENLHREDLNPLEEAAAYQQLIEDFELTHDEVATRVGKSRAAVTNLLRLFQLPPSIQKLVAEGQLSAGHAKALLGTPDRAFQEALAKRAVSQALSVRAVEDAVRNRIEPTDAAATPTERAPRLRPPGLLELEELLSDHLATRVKVEMAAKNGRVVVEFATLEDLERIYRAMTSARPPEDQPE